MTRITTVDPGQGRAVALVEAALIGNALERNNVRIKFSYQKDPVVSVVIVSLNARSMLTITLYRLASQQIFNNAPFEVIVVDNASAPDMENLFARLDGVNVIRNKRNVGFGSGCNLGARSARGRYILFLNPDVELMPGSMSALIAPFADPNVGITGPQFVFPGGYIQEAGAFFRKDAQLTHPYGRGNPDPFLPEASFTRSVGYVSGAALMIDRLLFEDVAGFDDLFSPAYFEDTDLCMRCRQKGRNIVYEPKAVAIHFENATSSSRAEVEELLDRNRRRFLDRHGSWLFPGGGTPVRFGDRDFDEYSLAVLYIDDAVPHVDSGSGMPRSNFIINTMSKLGYRVTVYPVYRSELTPAERYRDISGRVEILEAGGTNGLRQIVEQRRDYYDVLWVSRPHNIDLVCQVFQDMDIGIRSFIKSRLIFDSEALFSVRDFISHVQKYGHGNGDFLAETVRAETRNFAQADFVVCVSDAEARLVRSHGVRNATVLGHALEGIDLEPPGFACRNGFLFIGSLQDEGSPNVDSLDWFLSRAWPRVRQAIPDALLKVVGSISPEIRKRMERPGVSILGRVADPSTLFSQARSSIAPTRFAAGVPHKVHESVSRGLPAVVTPLLRDQLGWPEGCGYLVGDLRDPQSFAEVLIRIHEDETTWGAVQQQGIARVRAECDPDVYVKTLRNLCEAPVYA